MFRSKRQFFFSIRSLSLGSGEIFFEPLSCEQHFLHQRHPIFTKKANTITMNWNLNEKQMEL